MIASKKSVSLRSGASVQLVIGHSSSEKGSVFLGAMVYPVATKRDATEGIALLRALPDFAGATHRISAFISEDKHNYRDDDFEHKAGGVLHGTLKKLNACGAAVVVARWFGGHNIGKARFEHIRQRAHDLLTGVGHEPRQALSNVVWAESGPGNVLGGGQTAAALLSFSPRSLSLSSSELGSKRGRQGCAGMENELQQRRRLLAEVAERNLSHSQSQEKEGIKREKGVLKDAIQSEAKRLARKPQVRTLQTPELLMMPTKVAKEVVDLT